MWRPPALQPPADQPRRARPRPACPPPLRPRKSCVPLPCPSQQGPKSRSGQVRSLPPLPPGVCGRLAAVQQREPRPLVSEPRCREARAARPTAATPTTPEHRASAGSSVCSPRTPAGHWGTQVRAPQATIAPFMQSRRPVESQIRLCPQEVLSAVSSASPCQACHSTSPHFRRERRAIRFPRPGPRTAPERPSQVAFVSSALGFRGGDWRETPRRQDPQASARPPPGGCRPQRACVSGRAGSRRAKARFSHPRLR